MKKTEVVAEDVGESAGGEMARIFQSAAEECAAAEGIWAQRGLGGSRGSNYAGSASTG